ncbi:enoyl-CoA hydratase/isomerase family protein [Spongiibacter nanhainus]|uniref:Enoyl-CoA hydratase/isomerase family protein n=1 Tax=Spongiibacter nanhainus TaxID=2794344 RepID=A0A7T4QYY8_9GAMM|nr:enoyl-CoA hydratase-related protein [Spongiibacter nanhainus]QQD17351.1 enoyl-CoA hydratase/isomerase family protein [Spongiibacter nanhainus]
MSEAHLLFERLSPHIAKVTLNRPDKHNVISGDIAEGLQNAVHTVENDPQLRVAILCANGKTFCAGADLAEVSAGRGHKLTTKTGGFAGFVHEPRSKAWIAAVDGLAFGGGFELLLACDLAVISRDSQLGLPEPKRGLIAAAGGAFRVGRSLPKAIAIELAVTGRPMTAERALHFGLVNAVAEPGQVISTATALAEEIAANAPLSVDHSLALCKAAAECSEEELWQKTQQAVPTIMGSDDAKEGMRAFMEKRPANWQGK